MIGVQLAARACFDPEAAITVFEKLGAAGALGLRARVCVGGGGGGKRAARCCARAERASGRMRCWSPRAAMCLPALSPLPPPHPPTHTNAARAEKAQGGSKIPKFLRTHPVSSDRITAIRKVCCCCWRARGGGGCCGARNVLGWHAAPSPPRLPQARLEHPPPRTPPPPTCARADAAHCGPSVRDQRLRGSAWGHAIFAVSGWVPARACCLCPAPGGARRALAACHRPHRRRSQVVGRVLSPWGA